MRAAIYARVSTRDKGQDNENQLRELRAFADRSGYTVVGDYVDSESGARADRPQFLQLFQDAHQRRFDVVLFWALDRFSREGVMETLTYLQRLSNAGVQFKSYTEQYLDSTGLFRDAIIGILATIAKQERVRLGERTRAGMAKAVAKGKIVGRPGVDAQLVAEVQRLKGTGVSNRNIAKQLELSPSTVAKYLAE